MSKSKDVRSAIVAAIRQCLELKGVDPLPIHIETQVDRTLGLDSLDWAAVVVQLEEDLGVDPFEEGVERELRTVGDLVEVYQAALR